MPVVDARAIWQRIETLHAVTYFAPESIEAAKRAGLRGFWMGYFGFRASPLGPVPAAVIEATFANFHPSMVRRAVPDAWSFADPAELLSVRATAAAAALRRLAPSVDGVAAEAVPLLDAVITAADATGRPLFAANRDVPSPADPVEALWQSCTSLREHRGDGHVAALVAAGVDGCEAHLLFVADREISPGVHFDHRGWTEDDQSDALGRLRDRGLVVDDCVVLTDAGRRLRSDVEAATDAAAAVPFDAALSEAERERLMELLTTPAVEVARSGVLPYPNPMGLPSVAS